MVDYCPDCSVFLLESRGSLIGLVSGWEGGIEDVWEAFPKKKDVGQLPYKTSK
jgi:hypothetical protein